MSEGSIGRVRAGRPVRRKHLPLPWLDRGGRYSALKAAVFLGILTPGALLGTELSFGMMGGRPIQNTIFAVGRWVVGFMLMALAITPLRRIAAWPQATTLRRMLGLAALGYALTHLSLYVIDQNFRLGFVASEIANRVYLTIGFVTLLGLSLLGVISTDGWMRRLERRWKQIQRAVYVLGILALLHFFMQSKANVSPATLMAGFFLWLMLWRAMPANWQANAAALLGLAAASAVGTALLDTAGTPPRPHSGKPGADGRSPSSPAPARRSGSASPGPGLRWPAACATERRGSPAQWLAHAAWPEIAAMGF